MNREIISQIQDGIYTAFIDAGETSNLAYKPQFLSNNYKEGRKVLSSIEEELLTCDEFSISVAFVTMGGIIALLPTLKELESKGIHGRILTTDYLMFSEPKALDKLAMFSNIDLKMFQSKDAGEGFHSKGYIFKEKSVYRIIIGSSNMTASALTQNREWNTRLVSTERGEYAKQVINEFEELWNSVYTVGYDEFIENYRTNYEIIKRQKKIAKQETIPSIEQYRLQPNKMQVEFINSLRNLKRDGAVRALLISATGTGKTYASAFALREENSSKVLFLVHREQIAKQAITSYKKIFGQTRTFGLLSGNSKDYEADFLFSTMSMMAKQEVRNHFQQDEFHTIVIDEAHRVGAVSYQNIMDYFKPQFWLGMTASPERTDEFDVFKEFDHNVAYEIRLQQAMEENLLCPFHYFGITELQIDGEVLNEKSDFNRLTSDARVDYVIEQIKYYGYSGERAKGLIFCSSKEEAKALSNKFNERGYRTLALSGMDSQEKREEAIERLTTDKAEEQLDYILTVDIFNEGVDIPDVNQVIMLRPTKSPIVFVQQLGRGLRKAEGKEYVVILDFIGNYENNFMIPIALSGDRSYNKDNIRRYVMEGCRIIPGASTIHFDEISKSKIFHSIDQIKGMKEIIRRSYQNLKYRLGRVPLLIDFYKNGEVDPLVILDHYKTYDLFLRSVEKDCKIEELTNHEKLALEYLSKVVARGKRPHEVEVLSSIMDEERIEQRQVEEKIRSRYGLEATENEMESALHNLAGYFVSKDDEQKKYAQIDLIESEDSREIRRMKSFYERLNHSLFYTYVQDIIDIARARLQDSYLNKHREGEFVLYEKYSRRDVCQLLNCKRDLSSTMYGMKRIGEDACIFVTYNKQADVTGKEYLDGKPDYADEFVNNQIFMWDSQIGKGPDSGYMKEVLNAPRRRLFIKKSDSEGVDFYYMGMVDVVEVKAGTKKDNHGRMREITKVKVRMHQEVREDLFDYLKSTV